MKPRWRLITVLLIAIFTLASQTQGAIPRPERIVIEWAMGLGTGSQYEQIWAQEAVVEQFNQSQDEIELVFLCMCGGNTALDTLKTLIASGEAPDIVGPMGFQGANPFMGEWLDLQPLVEATNYDLTQFPPNLVEVYRSPDGLLALPFAVFPGVLFYNPTLFDEAGLNYPPTVVGEPYILPDGTAVPWDYDTVAQIAPLLTLDASGHNAADPAFDPDQIVQFGFTHQWDQLLSDFHTFGAAPLVDENGQVTIHENWRAAAHWLWEGVWVDHFIPNQAYLDQESINGTPFASGQVAMVRVMSWYTCCTEEVEWDLALQPAYNGTIYAPFHVDNFSIHKSTEHPQEAFTVLQYILGEAAPELIRVYGSYPARLDLQADFTAPFGLDFPHVQHAEVLATSALLAPPISHEAGFASNSLINDRLQSFLTLLYSEAGRDMDLDAELDRLEADLQAIMDQME